MKYLSLFSGIEAASAAWHPLGWEAVAVSEIEPFPCAVLAHHYPNVPNLGDVTQITEAQIAALGPIDLVVFGSPCQDLSVAGHRKGLLDADGNATRSGLFFTAINIFHWARKHCGARFALWENVPGAFSSSKGRDFGAVVEWMAGLDEVPVPVKGWGAEGCAVGDNGLLEWGVLDAQWFGVAQRRRRVFALLDTGDWAGRPPILLEPESLRGDTAPRRETRQDFTYPVAPCLTSSGRGVERTGDTRGQYPVVAFSVALRGREGGATAELGDEVGNALRASGGGGDKAHVLIHADPVARCVTTGEAKRQDWETCNFVAHTLRGEGFDASEDGTGRGTPLVPVGAIGWSEELNALEDVQPTIQRGGAGGRHEGVAYSIITANTNANGLGVTAELAPMLDSNNGSRRHNGTLTGLQVRRLTPTECERLQGFPDGYTQVPYRNKPAADGPRYKALGNSMAVPVMRWIGRQIDMALLLS